MCGRFIVVPKEVLSEIIQEIEANRPINPMPDWPAVRQAAYPGSDVSVALLNGGQLAATELRWGYEASWSRGLIFNTRVETALKPGRNMWQESLRERRCLVPTFGFYEPHQTETGISPRTGKEVKQQYLFTKPDDPVFFLAGVYECESSGQGRFSVLTTVPNRDVQPVHNRMPLVLEQHELETWLQGDYLTLFDRSAVRLSASKAV